MKLWGGGDGGVSATRSVHRGKKKRKDNGATVESDGKWGDPIRPIWEWTEMIECGR